MQTPIRILEILSLKSFTASEIQIALHLSENTFETAINKLIDLNYTYHEEGIYTITNTGETCLSTSNCLDIIWEIR